MLERFDEKYFPHSTLQSPKHYIVANEGLKGLEHPSEQCLSSRNLRSSAHVPRGTLSRIGRTFWDGAACNTLTPCTTQRDFRRERTLGPLGDRGGEEKPAVEAPRNPTRMLRRSWRESPSLARHPRGPVAKFIMKSISAGWSQKDLGLANAVEKSNVLTSLGGCNLLTQK